MLRPALAILLTIVLVPAQAVAECHFYGDIAKIFRYRGHHNAADYSGWYAVYDTNSRKPTTAWLFDPPQKSRFGLCSSMRVDISLRWDQAGPYEPRNDPTFDQFHVLYYVQPSSGSCPPPDDAGYIRTLDIPDGVFLELFGVWTRMRNSKATLQAMETELPPADKSVAESLASDLFEPGTASHMKLGSILPHTQLSYGDRSARMSSYALQIYDERDPMVWYDVLIDWTPAGFSIVGLEHGAA